MVSAHAVYCLMLAADLFRTVAAKKPIPIY